MSTMSPTAAERLQALVKRGTVESFFFVRHSKTAKRIDVDPETSEQIPQLKADLARTLTEEGVEKCWRAHEQLGKEGGFFPGFPDPEKCQTFPKICLVSPTIRTRDTARHVLNGKPAAGSHTEDDTLPKNCELREVDAFYNYATHEKGSVMNKIADELSYAPLSAYHAAGENGEGKAAYDAFARKALKELVDAVESAAAECQLGCVFAVGHAIDSPAIALAVHEALFGSASVADQDLAAERRKLLAVDMDTVSGIFVGKKGDVRYFTVDDRA